MLKVGDRIVYAPTRENDGVLEWDGVTGILTRIDEGPAVNSIYANAIARYGNRVRVKPDREFLRKVGDQFFWTFSSRVRKENEVEIKWEV